MAIMLKKFQVMANMAIMLELFQVMAIMAHILQYYQKLIRFSLIAILAKCVKYGKIW